MTRAGFVLGTPYYMAPEQVMGKNITEQVDVYSFGVLLFELLTGKKPISGDTVERIFYSILNEPLNLEPLHEAGVPQAVCDLVARCTAKKPEERPQGFEMVCGELERAIAGADAPTLVLPTIARDPATMALPAAATPAPVGGKASRPGWLLPVILVAIVGLGTGLYFALHSPAKVVETPPAPTTEAPALAATLSTPSGEMVLVPAGDFLFGEKKESASLPAFYIDKTEVTNEAYDRFCKEKATGRRPDSTRPSRTTPWLMSPFWTPRLSPNGPGNACPRRANGRRRRAARMAASTPGATSPTHRAPISGPARCCPSPICRKGASPCGALQMAGNVWELIDQTATSSRKTWRQYSAKMLRPPPARRRALVQHPRAILRQRGGARRPSALRTIRRCRRAGRIQISASAV